IKPVRVRRCYRLNDTTLPALGAAQKTAHASISFRGLSEWHHLPSSPIPSDGKWARIVSPRACNSLGISASLSSLILARASGVSSVSGAAPPAFDGDEAAFWPYWIEAMTLRSLNFVRGLCYTSIK